MMKIYIYIVSVDVYKMLGEKKLHTLIFINNTQKTGLYTTNDTLQKYIVIHNNHNKDIHTLLILTAI